MAEEEKKETFETPKVLNLEGQELTEDDLEEVSGGNLEIVPGDCTGGCCCSGS